MKRVCALILSLFLFGSLCACGEDAAAGQGSTPATTESRPTLPVTEESLSGTYKPRLWFLDHTLTFRTDSTYEFSDGETGTYALSGKSISMLAKDGANVVDLLIEDNHMHTYDTWYFDTDLDNDVTFSPDKNGHSDQSFEGRTPGGNIPGCDYSWILLDLDADGTFALKLGSKDGAEPEVKETFEGTYSTDKYILNLTYNGQVYPLIMANTNYIYFYIFDKV